MSGDIIDISLQLTDIHRHPDGNIHAQPLPESGCQFNLTFPAATLIPHVSVTATEVDLVSFLSALDQGIRVLAVAEAVVARQ